MELKMTLKQLEDLLYEQKKTTAEYMTRNLSVYSFFNEVPKLDITKNKAELIKEAMKSPYASDFEVLKKYHQ